MARLTSWIVLAVAAGVVIGCGPAKELPDEVVKAPDATEKPVAVPEGSEATAKAYLDKALKSYTSGKPEQVAKGKFSRLKLNGTLRDPNVNPPVLASATRNIAAVWPDRFVDLSVRQSQGKTVALAIYHQRPRLTILNEGVDFLPPNPVELEQNLAVDERGQYWMCLFLPMTDPKATVFDLRQQTLNQQPVQSLKLSLEKFPVYQLYFDAKTDALLRVEYTLTEQGVSRRRQWTMTDHKPGPEGLLLPGKMESRWDNVVVEEWTAEKWEFPATIDEAEFAPPKK